MESSNSNNVNTPEIVNVRELKLESMTNGDREEITDQDINQAELLKTLLANLKPEDFQENFMEAFRENSE